MRTTQIGPGAARVEGMSPLGRAPIATRRSRMPFRLGDARTSEVQVHNSSDRQRVSKLLQLHSWRAWRRTAWI